MSSPSQFANKFVLITGGSSGIGAACARLFYNHGAQVAITGRNKSALEAIARSLDDGKDSNRVKGFIGDVTVDDDVKRIVKESVDWSSTGKIDVLVNNAGVLKGGALDNEDGMDVFDYNMNTNVRGPVCFIHNCVPFMTKDRDTEELSAIVNVSSVNGLQSFGGVPAYCASKAALDMITDCAAVDLAVKGIRVNSVNPGVVITELQKRGGLDEAQYQAFLERSRSVTHPLGRVAEATEVAEAILFLSDSSKAGMITGTHLTVDGGRRCLGAR